MGKAKSIDKNNDIDDKEKQCQDLVKRRSSVSQGLNNNDQAIIKEKIRELEIKVNLLTKPSIDSTKSRGDTRVDKAVDPSIPMSNTISTDVTKVDTIKIPR